MDAPPEPPARDGGAPPPPAAPATPRLAEPPPGPARELKSDLFGYSIRLPNQRAWQMASAGASRHTVIRRDHTTRLRIWVDLRPESRRASARHCLREYLGNLHRHFARARLGVRARSIRRRRGAHGVTLLTTERLAQGSGPRRYAGHYLIAFAAVGQLCYGFEGVATRPASRQGRREVEAAYRSFDVDPTVLRKAGSKDVRANLTRIASAARARRNTAILMDTATALAAIWPRDALGWHLLGFGYLLRDRPSLALAALRKARQGDPPADPEAARLHRFGIWTLMADAYARESRWVDAYAAIEQARRILPDHPGLAYAEACVNAMRGRKEKAMDLIEESFRAWPPRAVPPRISHGLLVQVALARRDIRLRSLRGEPRFEVLMRRFEARARKAR